MGQETRSIAALAAGGIAALLASACCLGPLLLVMLGVTGAWMGQLQALEPLRPFAIGAAILALALAYRRIFRPQADCAPGDLCAVPRVRLAYKLVFWGVVVLVAVALAYPYAIPYFL
jgi:mercuric ion transport protein